PPTSPITKRSMGGGITLSKMQVRVETSKAHDPVAHMKNLQATSIPMTRYGRWGFLHLEQ
ncbi:MAG: hypothetical protein Q9198_010892, partial [Flavoplaca austrocitrina]